MQITRDLNDEYLIMSMISRHGAEIGVNLAPKWKIWLQDFEMYLVASGVTDKKRKERYYFTRLGRGYVKFFARFPITETMMISIRQ